MKITHVVFFVFIILLTSLAQQAKSKPCKCCSIEHNQFDFWVGNWAVYDTLNNLVGTNKILKNYDNCLLQENWVSKGKNKGTSYNYYNPSDSTWNQLWIDNQGTILKLKGSFEHGKMILKSDLQRGKKVDWYYNRISWQLLDNGNVVQTWDILSKNNSLIANLFKGIYKPSEE